MKKEYETLQSLKKNMQKIFEKTFQIYISINYKTMERKKLAKSNEPDAMIIRSATLFCTHSEHKFPVVVQQLTEHNETIQYTYI